MFPFLAASVREWPSPLRKWRSNAKLLKAVIWHYKKTILKAKWTWTE